ncbi:PEP-CTERM system histidine kinase PrsK [Desulfopila sp. IMCC35006]|uniref:XrtA/PEP-CTERM system histidine kinase PrsK n=1 Tax=Desulfopila sp. IMCC35006 TaxID=2569542 RepID=UPI0010ABD1B9|nr:XrtA/PEP-CTERM system histidine kinase PrsK [Desulfopila sp. IMCC35006]TKB25010.1 PEP-CTERM system histidine kinase PrsK [Desulfopila sp. IMCC35006]
MLIPFFYTLNVLILLAGLLGFRQGSGEKYFSIALVQSLLVLPLLACEYLFLAYSYELQIVQLVLFSEIIFGLIWFSLALRMRQATQDSVRDVRLHFLAEIIFGAVSMSIAGYLLAFHSVILVFDNGVLFQADSLIYFFNLFVLAAVLYSAWRLEQFWRSLDKARRWEYRFLVVGSYLVCAAMAWASSYRLTYLTILPKHLQLLSLLLFSGWIMIAYEVFHHRLLQRRIIVSRRVVYTFVVPSLLAIYLTFLGIISLLMRTFGLEMFFVLKWLFVALGFVAVGLFICSGRIRRRTHFFISRNFYANKYEYRDEWLALLQQLQGAASDAEVVKALGEVLAGCLYTKEIMIWLGAGNSSQGYTLVFTPEKLQNKRHEFLLSANDPLVNYLHSHAYFNSDEQEPDESWQEVKKATAPFFSSLGLKIIVPMAIGTQLTGFIGLGPEYTGAEYGHDDFDLLTALGSQTAAALLALRVAEEMAHTREQQAWHRLSAFVLHDIKNAATMLALLQENAPAHIHEPEFQQDMLELVDDALKRMGRVEQRLSKLKDEIKPSWQDLELNAFLRNCIRSIKKKLPSLQITFAGAKTIQVRSDPELLGSVMENLLLNAYEAGGEGTLIHLETDKHDDAHQVALKIIDNGPGIAIELLPDALFEPFRTNKDGGSGIGLWQVQRVVTSLQATISADNNPDGGAQFVILLPLAGGVE